MRESGEPYYSHPLEVAYMASDYLPRTDIIITAILHDTLEDTDLTKEEIAEVFGSNVAEKVYDLTRIKVGGVKISSAQMLEELWLQKKNDVLLIKLFDRIHNMQTISAKSPEKMKKISDETLKNFLLISEALEISKVSDELAVFCYEANKKLHLVDSPSHIFDKPFSLDLAIKSLKIS